MQQKIDTTEEDRLHTHTKINIQESHSLRNLIVHVETVQHRHLSYKAQNIFPSYNAMWSITSSAHTVCAVYLLWGQFFLLRMQLWSLVADWAVAHSLGQGKTKSYFFHPLVLEYITEINCCRWINRHGEHSKTVNIVLPRRGFFTVTWQSRLFIWRIICLFKLALPRTQLLCLSILRTKSKK